MSGVNASRSSSRLREGIDAQIGRWGLTARKSHLSATTTMFSDGDTTRRAWVASVVRMLTAVAAITNLWYTMTASAEALVILIEDW